MFIGNATPDEQAAGLCFPDVHYFAASATRWGADVQGAYEYSGKDYTDKEYAGFFAHGFGKLDMCGDCHDEVGQPIAHQATWYPYFFVVDHNDDGIAGEIESKAANAYKTWTPRLLRAAYNYQNSISDPGAFAHDAPYIIQTLYDSIEDLGADVSTLIRP